MWSKRSASYALLLPSRRCVDGAEGELITTATSTSPIESCAPSSLDLGGRRILFPEGDDQGGAAGTRRPRTKIRTRCVAWRNLAAVAAIGARECAEATTNWRDSSGSTAARRGACHTGSTGQKLGLHLEPSDPEGCVALKCHRHCVVCRLRNKSATVKAFYSIRIWHPPRGSLRQLGERRQIPTL
jgi:hypothetical protein